MTIKTRNENLADRMPTLELAAKLGVPAKNRTPSSLASRMPSPEIAAKVGDKGHGRRTHRVVRRNALN